MIQYFLKLCVHANTSRQFVYSRTHPPKSITERSWGLLQVRPYKRLKFQQVWRLWHPKRFETNLQMKCHAQGACTTDYAVSDGCWISGQLRLGERIKMNLAWFSAPLNAELFGIPPSPKLHWIVVKKCRECAHRGQVLSHRWFDRQHSLPIPTSASWTHVWQSWESTLSQVKPSITCYCIMYQSCNYYMHIDINPFLLCWA